MSELKDKTVTGVFWSAVDRFSAQGIQFVFSILIARLLLPEDYGVIAMLNIFLAVSQNFIDSGFGAALIRKNDRTETDFSTVFYFNIIVAFLIYIALFFASPYIADFYETPVLRSITRVVALNLIITSFSGIHNSKLSIDVDFKSRAKISLLSSVVSGIVALYMAKNGFGVWALVAQSLCSSIVWTILLWYFVRWKPLFQFSWESFRNLFSFGSKLLTSAVLNTIYSNLSTIIIGKFFSSSSLGLYSKANSLAQFPSVNITNVIQNVAFPVLSKIQDETQKLKAIYVKFMRIMAFIIFPLMLGLAAVSQSFVSVVLTEKWVGAVPYIQVLCFSLMWYPIHAINLSILSVKGRSDYFLKLEIYKKVLGVVILAITVPMGIMAMCYGMVISSVLSLFINTYYTKKLIDYGFGAQIIDLLPILLHSLVMWAVVHVIVYFMPTTWLKLIVGVLSGMIYYIAGAYIMKFPEMDELLTILKLKKK